MLDQDIRSSRRSRSLLAGDLLPEAPAYGAGQRISLVTQNLYGMEHPEQDANHVHRIHAFADFLQREQPDIVAIQELQRWSVRLLAPTFKHLYPHALYVTSNEEPPWTVVLSRFPRLRQERIEGIGAWRGMDMVLLNASGTILTVASAHFRAADCPHPPTEVGGEGLEHTGVGTALERVGRAGRAGRAVGRAVPGDGERIFLEQGGVDSTSGCPGGEERVADLRAALQAVKGKGSRE